MDGCIFHPNIVVGFDPSPDPPSMPWFKDGSRDGNLEEAQRLYEQAIDRCLRLLHILAEEQTR